MKFVLKQLLACVLGFSTLPFLLTAQKAVYTDQFYYDCRDLKVLRSIYLHKGDSVFLQAQGDIITGVVGQLHRSPNGASYADGKYNLIKEWNNCALITTVSTDTTLKIYNSVRWKFCGTNLAFKTEQEGYLLFDINQEHEWRWTVKPLNRGFKISIQVKSQQKKLGILYGNVVYMAHEQVMYENRSFYRSPKDSAWHILDPKGEELGLYVAQPRSLIFQKIGIFKNAPLYFNEEHGIVRYQQKYFYRENDGYWHISSAGLPVGIFIKETPFFFEHIGSLKKKGVYANWAWNLVLYVNQMFERKKGENYWEIKDIDDTIIGIVHRTPLSIIEN